MDEKAELVWTPAGDRCVLPAEIPELRPKLYELEQRRVTASFKSACILAVFSAISLTLRLALKSQTAQRDLLVLMSFGLLPLIDSYFRLRQLRNFGSELLARELDGNRFDYWRKRNAPRKSAHAVALALCLLFVLQCVTGLADSTHLLGLRRDEVLQGQVWRLLTCGLLHANLLHMFFNGVAIWAYWLLLGALIGVPRLLSCLLLSIVGGSLASVAWHAHTWSLGVSGGIAGLIGYELTLFVEHRVAVPWRVLRATLWLIAANALIGLFGARFIDNAAHLGGLLSGVLCAWVSRTVQSSLPLPRSRSAARCGFVSGALLLAAAGFVAAGLISN